MELDGRDECYARNRVLEILQRVEGEELSADEQDEIYGALSLLPSAVNAKFQTLCKENTKAATDWLYQYCVHNDYVKKAVLDKNPRFEAEGLIITIIHLSVSFTIVYLAIIFAKWFLSRNALEKSCRLLILLLAGSVQ